MRMLCSSAQWWAAHRLRSTPGFRELAAVNTRGNTLRFQLPHLVCSNVPAFSQHFQQGLHTWPATSRAQLQPLMPSNHNCTQLQRKH